MDSGAERWDGGTVRDPPKLQSPTEENPQGTIQGLYGVYKYTDLEGGAAVQGLLYYRTLVKQDLETLPP